MRFEWDEKKNETNKKKHGISFEEIIGVFDDPLFWERRDEAHSTVEEERFLGVGKVNGFAVIVSCFTERGEVVRIISARVATKEEERRYEKWCKGHYS